MGLVVLGVLIFVVAIFAGKTPGPLARYKGLMLLAGIVLVAIGVATAAIRIIPPGNVGVQILFGKVNNKVLYEGLNFVNPLIEIYQANIRTQNYTMSQGAEEGMQQSDDAITILSNDGLNVNVDITILYRINPPEAPNIYRNLGPNYERVIVRPVVRTGIRNSAAQFKAIDIFADKRQAFEDNIRSTIQDTLTQRGFILDQILVRKIDLPLSVKESIERKITAIQEAERMEFVLDKERQEADRRRVEAQGIADAQLILDKGLTPRVLSFETIQMQKALANSQNSKLIILGDSKNTPFILNP
jgi:regulator of protease activity HflC (stomatin/prohibitin superfamily)